MQPLYKLVPGRHGRFFINKNDTYVGKSLDLYGEWSEPEIDLFSQIITQGDVVIEAGANIGSHTVWLSKQVGDFGKVYAFEPARHTFQVLCSNLVANDLTNVIAVNKALGAENKAVKFPALNPRGSWNFGGASMKKSWTEDFESVDLVSLNNISLDHVDFIKADVEGFELELLDGASILIERDRPVVYLEINAQAVRDGALSYFDKLNYSCWYYITPMYSPNNYRAAAHDYFNDYSFDMLCLPNEKFKVEGMTQATMGDSAITYKENQTIWATYDWSNARVTKCGTS